MFCSSQQSEERRLRNHFCVSLLKQFWAIQGKPWNTTYFSFIFSKRCILTADRPNLNCIYYWPTLRMAHRVRMERHCENPIDPIVHFRTICAILVPNTILYRTDLAVWDAPIISARKALLAKQQTHEVIALINSKIHCQREKLV